MFRKIVSITFLMLIASTVVIFAAKENSGQVKFYGVFTTDTYPVHGYKITEAGDTISTASVMFQSQGNDLNSEESNYLGSLTDAMLNGVRQSLIDKAKKDGYQAVIGYKLTVAQTFNGYGSSVINGKYGVGYASIMAQGVPVKIEEKNWFWE